MANQRTTFGKRQREQNRKDKAKAKQERLEGAAPPQRTEGAADRMGRSGPGRRYDRRDERRTGGDDDRRRAERRSARYVAAERPEAQARHPALLTSCTLRAGWNDERRARRGTAPPHHAAAAVGVPLVFGWGLFAAKGPAWLVDRGEKAVDDCLRAAANAHGDPSACKPGVGFGFGRLFPEVAPVRGTSSTTFDSVARCSRSSTSWRASRTAHAAMQPPRSYCSTPPISRARSRMPLAWVRSRRWPPPISVRRRSTAASSPHLRRSRSAMSALRARRSHAESRATSTAPCSLPPSRAW